MFNDSNKRNEKILSLSDFVHLFHVPKRTHFFLELPQQTGSWQAARLLQSSEEATGGGVPASRSTR